jgi:hypothetical protein
MNIGSGHDRASGGFFAEADPENCVAQIKAWMHKNAPVFQ